jgi:hypothetical protein
MNPATWHWKWIIWQVVIPLAGPVLISAGVVCLWQLGDDAFRINWHIVLDVSPWALTFFCMTLIGAAMSDLWPKISNHAMLVLCLFAIFFTTAIYASFIVIWRHRPGFEPGTAVYVFAFFLVALSVIFCHVASET